MFVAADFNSTKNGWTRHVSETGYTTLCGERITISPDWRGREVPLDVARHLSGVCDGLHPCGMCMAVLKRKANMKPRGGKKVAA